MFGSVQTCYQGYGESNEGFVAIIDFPFADVPERQITDNVVIVHEVVHSMRA